jgi:diphosphomevalonate decarboxylase
MPALKGSSDDFATPLATRMHDVFKTYRDAILIVSKAEKSVSSRAGHGLMEGNAFARPRYAQARARMKTLLAAIRAGDVETFGQISEDEALTLHALMMTGSPSYILMRPNSLRMIEMIRAYRAETRQPLYFSLDAGPNLHLLYPESNATAIESFITSELVPLCEDRRWIADRVGLGAAKVTR